MIESGFFNSVDGDRVYNADSFNDFFSGVLTDTGVYKTYANRLVVIRNTGMTIDVGSGMARIRGHWVKLTTEEHLTLSDASATMYRKDAVVLHFSESSRMIDLRVVEGSYASSEDAAEVPTLADGVDSKEICLAIVSVKAGATSITADDITDTRDDEAYCGYVKMIVDTVNAGIREYRSYVTTEAETSQITIGIAQFDPTVDLIFANINGVMFSQGIDYTIVGTGSAAIMVLNNSITAGNTIEFRVIKSVIEVL